MATLTQTARNAMATLSRAAPGLRESPPEERSSHKRDLGEQANEARKEQPSASAQVARERAQVAEQERLQREAAQSAQRGEERQSPEQETSARRQTPQQKQAKATSIVTKAWQMVLHHVPKKIMGLARAMGMPVEYAEAVGAAKHGVDTRKEVASAVSYKNTAKMGDMKLTPDNARAAPQKQKGYGLAA